MAKILKHSGYNPGRGGHAPGDLRDAFCEGLDALKDWQAGKTLPTVEVRDQKVPVDEAFRLLWNCKDILPSTVADEVIELLSRHGIRRPHRCTYAAASRLLVGLA